MADQPKKAFHRHFVPILLRVLFQNAGMNGISYIYRPAEPKVILVV